MLTECIWEKGHARSRSTGILGKEFIIGGTANTFDDVKMHYKAGADYIGCGPFRLLLQKDLSPVLGLKVTVPLFCK